ncbi:MAG: ABC transporter ATP-binding protein [Thermoprotei archaeon]|nr:ABC transporter ATP-binding protein [Thermoprotei archaeon]
MALIELEQVYYRYPGSLEWTLKGVSLEVWGGRILVMGSTGSGKSTLLRVMAGLAPGVYGGELRGHVAVNSNVALVPQDFDLYILMNTPRLELEYVLSGRGLGLSEARREAYRIAGELGLKHLIDRDVFTLSMGERQRVAVASAIALEPEVLILDEPLAFIDGRASRELLEFMESLEVKAVVIAEHKIWRLAEWAERVIVVEDGRIAADGGPEIIPSKLSKCEVEGAGVGRVYG